MPLYCWGEVGKENHVLTEQLVKSMQLAKMGELQNSLSIQIDIQPTLGKIKASIINLGSLHCKCPCRGNGRALVRRMKHLVWKSEGEGEIFECDRV